MGGFALWFVPVRAPAFLLVCPPLPSRESPPGSWLESSLHWYWSSAPDIYLPSLGLVPRGVEAGQGQESQA
ncbi:hypothetical protein K443DRAFT_677342 [Laccaria amethystina LaAM-08-1]|uniref:Secreted protein n=1 Tax=Laccaria amethystina LaAM-08-1 TaxID=1095629 RepID=A0A0C9XCX5_9AGAR|nr:hypothetical protein K443DRAFT_677342 [Laccaria amethystina LaAM-08-1]